MRKLTKLQAYEECEKMWRWLAKNPTKCKRDYFIGKSFRLINECWFCEYKYRRAFPCFNCLGKDLWGSRCEGEKSPYHLWGRSRNTSKTTKYALIIADFCKMKIEELYGVK